MKIKKARKILKGCIHEESGGLYDNCDVIKYGYLNYYPPEDDKNATLDGSYSAEKLEAIACWMRHVQYLDKHGEE